jgi:hypothetical protein
MLDEPHEQRQLSDAIGCGVLFTMLSASEIYGIIWTHSGKTRGWKVKALTSGLTQKERREVAKKATSVGRE